METQYEQGLQGTFGTYVEASKDTQIKNIMKSRTE